MVTQRGLYRWLRLEFGLVGAPTFFQYIMDSALAGEVDVDAYLDDCSCVGADWKACWQCTLRSTCKLADIGLMLNMHKSCFLMDDFGLLGFRVWNGCFSMAEKTLRVWADLQAP